MKKILCKKFQTLFSKTVGISAASKYFYLLFSDGNFMIFKIVILCSYC